MWKKRENDVVQVRRYGLPFKGETHCSLTSTFVKVIHRLTIEVGYDFFASGHILDLTIQEFEGEIIWGIRITILYTPILSAL